ncbi:MAG: NADH-quinone oxidoreductase subunit C [Geodermatophilaceae bacterium]
MTSTEHGELAVPGTPPEAQRQRGMFGVSGSGDTSGFGGLVRVAPGSAVTLHSSERPYGGYFDELMDAIEFALGAKRFAATVQRVVLDRGELTLHVARERLVRLCKTLRDHEALRFELLSSVSGVDYLGSGGAHEDRLHAVYHVTSMTFRRRIRLEVAVPDDDATIPSVTGLYPTADWQERETWDMFGIVFEGHPGLTRILMPDDWDGFPQRKDYPLGGVPVDYKGATIAPPDERRSYR